MVNVTIDGLSIEVPYGTTVLDAAKIAGIEIPTLCHFPHLEPYGGCRLCVVDVEGARVLQPSCTLPVNDGMVVYTNTPKVRQAREFVLTLLFSERNHFCMYCQVSGGDCELQNAAYAEGMTHWPIQPNWKPFPVDASHPYFVLDHNRCILCRRCIRACGDLVGNFTLASSERGANTMVIADHGIELGQSSCIRCGTCVSVCPTGALIDRQSAYRGRIEDSVSTRSICIECSIGCETELVTRDNQLLKINGVWNSPVSEGLLCEFGRFKPLYDQHQRILTPLVKKNGALKAATWAEALGIITSRLDNWDSSTGRDLAVLASTRLPAEALATVKELFGEKIKAGLVASVEEDYTYTGLRLDREFEQTHGNLNDLKESDCVVVIGADLFENHQVAGFFVKRNLPTGIPLIVIDPFENQMDEYATFTVKPAKGTDMEVLLGFMQQITHQEFQRHQGHLPYDLSLHTPEAVSSTTKVPADQLVKAAQAIGMSAKPVFIYGKGLTGQRNPEAKETILALFRLAQLVNGKLINTKGRANSLAANIYGLDATFDPRPYKTAYIALGDDMISQRQMQLLENVPFVAVQASYVSQLTARADVVLPVETWMEQEGHFVNMEGRLQKTSRCIEAPEQVLSNLEVLNRLAEALELTLQNGWDEPIFRYRKQTITEI
jgi:formate dehydrogenase major subunit